MPAIYIAAIIATIMSFIFWGGLIYYYFLEKIDKYILLLPITVIFCPLINLFIKTPLVKILKEIFHVQGPTTLNSPILYLAIFLLIPGVTEEIIKAIPAFFMKPFSMDSNTLFRIAYILGFGFGIGEIWYIAYGVTKDTSLAGYPFYYFMGFMSERFLAVMLHIGLTVIALTGLGKRINKPTISSIILAILLHTLIDIGAFAYQMKICVINQTITQFLLYAWIVIFTVLFINILIAKIRVLRW